MKSKDLRIGKSVRTFEMRTDLLVRRSFDALSLAQDDIEGEFVRLFTSHFHTHSPFKQKVGTLFA